MLVGEDLRERCCGTFVVWPLQLCHLFEVESFMDEVVVQAWSSFYSKLGQLVCHDLFRARCV